MRGSPPASRPRRQLTDQASSKQPRPARPNAGQALSPLNPRIWKRGLLIFSEVVRRLGGLFNRHVVKLFGVKDFATLQALDKLRVFVSGNDSYPGVFAGGCHRIGFSSIMMLFPPIVAAFR